MLLAVSIAIFSQSIQNRNCFLFVEVFYEGNMEATPADQTKHVMSENVVLPVMVRPAIDLTMKVALFNFKTTKKHSLCILLYVEIPSDKN